MKVLSLCDGMSCGQIALKKLNIPVDDYIIQKADVKNWEIAQYKNKKYTDLYYNNPYENGKY